MTTDLQTPSSYFPEPLTAYSHAQAPGRADGFDDDGTAQCPRRLEYGQSKHPSLCQTPPACTFPTSSTYNALKCLNEQSRHLLKGPPGSLLELKVLGKEGRNALEPGF